MIFNRYSVYKVDDKLNTLKKERLFIIIILNNDSKPLHLVAIKTKSLKMKG